MIGLKNFLKFFCLVTFIVTLMAESVFAEGIYPDTLDSGNLVLVDGGMGVGRYADRSSVKVQTYDPPNYQLSIRIVSVIFSNEYYSNHDTYVGGPYKIEDSYVRSFRYNWDRKVISYEYGNDNIWVDWDVNHDYSHAEGEPLIPNTAEVAFVSAYNMRFFDTKMRYSPGAKEHYRIISEDFYRTLNI